MANFLYYFFSLALLVRIANGQFKPVEHCNPDWVSLDETLKLYSDINRRLYGQHLASNIIFKAIKGHLNNKTPKKALVMSFIGMKGTDKNYAGQIIVESIYKKGLSSQYVKLIIGSHDFKHRNELEKDKMKLKNWITEIVSKCPRSLFIFDEVEKIRPELIDVLKPFLSHYHEVDGVDYRKSIFIFIRNTGGDLINEEIMFNFENRRWREDTIQQMFKVGGFLHSTLLEHQLVDYFVPFLPLEKHEMYRRRPQEKESSKSNS